MGTRSAAKTGKDPTEAGQRVGNEQANWNVVNQVSQ